MEYWSTGVWEYCAESELHPTAPGLAVLKQRYLYYVDPDFLVI
jgi:hypothetical protein